MIRLRGMIILAKFIYLRRSDIFLDASHKILLFSEIQLHPFLVLLSTVCV